MHKFSKVGYFLQITCKNQWTRIKDLNVRLKLWQYWKYGRITIPYVDNNFVNVRQQEFIEKERKGGKQIIETKTNHKMDAQQRELIAKRIQSKRKSQTR